MSPADFPSLIQPESAWEPGKPGFFRLREPVYRAAPGESQTGLKPILESGKHYLHHRKHPFAGSDASRFGTLLHGALFEDWRDNPDTHAEALKGCVELAGDGDAGLALFRRFIHGLPAAECYVVSPKFDMRTTAGKAGAAAFAAENSDRLILTPQQETAVEKWAGSGLESMRELDSDDGLQLLLSHSPPECRELAFFCELEGIWIKGRIDAVCLLPSEICLLDLKVTTEAGQDHWLRKVMDMGYDFQTEYYSKAVQKLAGLDYNPPSAWIVQESAGPWCHNIWSPSPEMRQLGWEKVVRALTLLKRYQEAGDFPGYSKGLKELRPAPWHLKSWQQVEQA